MPFGRWPRWVTFLFALAMVGCPQRQDPSVGSETHFLTTCDATCPDGHECICGVCTKRCVESLDCVGLLQNASCGELGPRIAEGRCSGTALQPVATCDLTCLVDSDCAALGAAFGCQSGYCRSIASPPNGAAADAGITEPCPGSVIPADQVLVLGDSLIALTAFTANLEQLAANAGALAVDEHFRQSASATASFMAEGPYSIGAQYSTVRTQGTARVVVMDGGETDMFAALCDTPPAYACPTVQAAVSGAQRLLGQMASDGVEHIVYFFYPDPPVGNQSVKYKPGLDTLRPLIENVCGQSPVACHWVDLRTTFVGHDDYLLQDGLMLSETGAVAAATAVWQMLQQRCVMP